MNLPRAYARGFRARLKSRVKPQKQWQFLKIAEEKFAKIHESLILVWLYNQARIFSRKTFDFLLRPDSAPACGWFQKPKNFPLFFFFAGGRDFLKIEREILRVLSSALSSY